MTARNYTRLSIEEFGNHLLKSGDLDPIYSALVAADFGAVGVRRWCLSYWTFYSAATASYIAEAETAEEFWRRFKLAATNMEPAPPGGRWPRGQERRHMRGENAARCFEDLHKRYPNDPEGFVYYVTKADTCRGVMKRVADHTQFGPWIGFKVADMMERCLDTPIDFSASEIFMFNDPKKAALMLWRRMTRQPEQAKPRDEADALTHVTKWLQQTFGRHKAPPHFDRPVGLQEVETILCKWKSHSNGHYPPNHDTIEIRAGLESWVEHSPWCARFLEAMPEVQPWT